MSFVAVHALAQSAPPTPPGPPEPQPKQPPAQPPPAPQQPPPSAEQPPVELPAVDPKWLDRMPKEDREAIDVLRGYAPPPLADDVKWIDSEKLDWARFRGKVLVVQSWTTGNTAGRGWPVRIANALKEIDGNELAILALHTPEKAEGAEDFIKRQKPPEGVVVAVDPSGRSCDALGIYKHPVNFVVDRNGVVRYAGLNLNGLKSAAAELVKEEFDRKIVPPQRPEEKPADQSASASQFPPVKGRVYGATDLRGKPAPEFVSESWYTNQTNPGGRVAIFTFWKADEPASLGSHEHLKELASHFGDRAAVIVISGDSRSNFEQQTMQKRLNKSDFEYAVALDKNQQMANAMQVTAFPHTIVVSKDWNVRWQGQTSALTPTVVEQIIEADAASAPADQPGAPAKRRGWVQS